MRRGLRELWVGDCLRLTAHWAAPGVKNGGGWERASEVISEKRLHQPINCSTRSRATLSTSHAVSQPYLVVFNDLAEMSVFGLSVR